MKREIVLFNLVQKFRGSPPFEYDLSVCKELQLIIFWVYLQTATYSCPRLSEDGMASGFIIRPVVVFQKAQHERFRGGGY